MHGSINENGVTSSHQISFSFEGTDLHFGGLGLGLRHEILADTGLDTSLNLECVYLGFVYNINNNNI